MFRAQFALSALLQLVAAVSPLYMRSPGHGLSHDELSSLTTAVSSSTEVKVPPAFTIEMPIDHFNLSDSRTYRNRYWFNATYFKPGGPVFFYDAGESGVDNVTVLVLLSELAGPSAPMALARKYNGLAIMWEHRFYGESLPFTVDLSNGLADAGYEAYKYLNNEQALEDVVYFATHFELPLPFKDRHTYSSPGRSPWVFIGGSYPGVRAAMIRLRNPEIIFASWASSAPVQAQTDMSCYYNPIQQALPANCSADVHVFLTGFLNPLVNVTKPTPIWEYATAADSMTLYDIANVLGYAFVLTTTNYQSDGFAIALQPFCDYLETYNPHNTTSAPSELEPFANWLNNSRDAPSTTSGVARTFNASVALDALLCATYQKMLDDNSTYSTRTYPSNVDSILWTWQYCTEFGYLQDANLTNPDNLLSRFNNISSWELFNCQETFPYAELPKLPNVNLILENYHGWNMTPSNTMFSNGEVDPWRTLGVQADKNINPAAVVRKSTTHVPECNSPPLNGAVFGQVYNGQVHAQDIIKVNYRNRTGAAPFDLGFDLFTTAFDQWITCFPWLSVSGARKAAAPARLFSTLHKYLSFSSD